MTYTAVLYKIGQKFYSNTDIFWNPVLLHTLRFVWKMKLCFFFLPGHNFDLINKKSHIMPPFDCIRNRHEENRYAVFFLEKEKDRANGYFEF